VLDETAFAAADLQRVTLGVQHDVVDERVTRDRHADHPFVVLDRRAVRPVHLAADRQHAGVQHGAAELPQQHQLHDELGQHGTSGQVHALERRTFQTLLQIDMDHVQSVVTVLGH